MAGSLGEPPRGVVLWLRDARGTRPVRVEVVGFADARGPFGATVLTTPRRSPSWPATRRRRATSCASRGRERARAGGRSEPGRAGPAGHHHRRRAAPGPGRPRPAQHDPAGFMGVGLLAGAGRAGATLSTRAVVERRRQIGVLRAVGFTARPWSPGLLVEAAVVSALGAALGVGLGPVRGAQHGRLPGAPQSRAALLDPVGPARAGRAGRLRRGAADDGLTRPPGRAADPGRGAARGLSPPLSADAGRRAATGAGRCRGATATVLRAAAAPARAGSAWPGRRARCRPSRAPADRAGRDCSRRCAARSHREC